MVRIVATLFIVAFFSALPLWCLSKQRGWVTLIGKRQGPADPFDVTVVRRNAFSTSREVLAVLGADMELFPRPIGRRSSGDRVALVLEVEDGTRYEVMDDVAPSILSLPRTMGPIKARVNLINTARDAGQTDFTIEIPPDATFWLMFGLTVLFAAAGLLIAFGGSQSAAVSPQ